VTYSTEALKSRVLERRQGAFASLSTERSRVISELLSVLAHRSESRESDTIEPDSTEHLALQALGVLRAAEAVQALMGFIKVRAGGFPARFADERLPLEAYFVALRSLIQIGSPSIRYLLETIAVSSDPVTTQLAAVAMVRIDGPDVTLHRLNALRSDVRSGMRAGSVHNVDRAIALSTDPTAVSDLKSVITGTSAGR
jgi:HEAT repeat protein